MRIVMMCHLAAVLAVVPLPRAVDVKVAKDDEVFNVSQNDQERLNESRNHQAVNASQFDQSILNDSRYYQALNATNHGEAFNLSQHYQDKNPCQRGAKYEMYREYSESECPAVNKFVDDEGNCDVSMFSGTDEPCASFCQVRTLYTYEQEEPFFRSWCHGYPGRVCKICPDDEAHITHFFDCGDNCDIYNKGITGGWQTGGKIAKAENKEQSLGKHECGYWTFLPVIKTVCGSTTRTSKNPDMDPRPIYRNTCILSDPSLIFTFPNVCVRQVWGSYDDVPDGKTVFVRTDCQTRERLPDDKQPADYRRAIKMPSDEYAKMLDKWQDNTCKRSPEYWAEKHEIRGRGFGPNLGLYGGGLLANIRDCAAPSKWTFEYNTDPAPGDYWEWTASFDSFPSSAARLCVRHALLVVGGPDVEFDKCD